MTPTNEQVERVWKAPNPRPFRVFSKSPVIVGYLDPECETEAHRGPVMIETVRRALFTANQQFSAKCAAAEYHIGPNLVERWTIGDHTQ